MEHVLAELTHLELKCQAAKDDLIVTFYSVKPVPGGNSTPSMRLEKSPISKAELGVEGQQNGALLTPSAIPTWFLVFSISERILWMSRLSSEISPFVLRRSSPCFPAVACSSSN